MDLSCFAPSSPSGGFTLLAIVVAFAAGAAVYRWVMRSKYAEQMAALEAKGAALEDRIRSL